MLLKGKDSLLNIATMLSYLKNKIRNNPLTLSNIKFMFKFFQFYNSLFTIDLFK